METISLGLLRVIQCRQSKVFSLDRMFLGLKLVNSIVIEEKNKIIKYTHSVGNMLPKTVSKRPYLIRNFIQTSYSHIHSPGMESPSVHMFHS